VADTIKVLGQAYPSPATITTLYTTPALTSAVVSTLVICNLSSTVSDTVSVLIRVGGAAASNPQYILSLMPVGPNDTYTATIGISLAATDIVSCFATNGTCSFNLFGVQIT